MQGEHVPGLNLLKAFWSFTHTQLQTGVEAAFVAAGAAEVVLAVLWWRVAPSGRTERSYLGALSALVDELTAEAAHMAGAASEVVAANAWRDRMATEARSELTSTEAMPKLVSTKARAELVPTEAMPQLAST